MTINEINQVIRSNGVDASVERSSEDGSYALDRPLSRFDSRRLVLALEAAGVEASDAEDQGDDRGMWWVHVTVTAEAQS